MPARSALAEGGGTLAKAMVWIEDAGSRITRGEACSVTSGGAQVRLAETPAFGSGDDVAVRIAFARGAATVATAARVESLRTGPEGTLCQLSWTGPANERRALESWLARAA